MEEKEIIRGRSKSFGAMPAVLLVLGFISLIINLIYAIPNAIEHAHIVRRSTFEIFWWYALDTPIYTLLFFGGILLIIVALYFLFQSKCEIVVTTKRVYGKAVFGKQVDLPIDSITAVGTSAFNGIAVASSSGRIVFRDITNRDAVRSAISDLLMARQEKRSTPTTIKQEIPKSEADEIKKYKELLDSGIITQEEFEAKKKQLLGL